MDTPAEFLPLPGLYEPSAIQQLPDGRFLVVEDEKRHPFSLLEIGADGRVASTPLTPGFFQSFDAFWKLDDLEALACDDKGWLYAVTSHSRAGDGEEKRARDKLVRFRIEGNRIVEHGLSRRLKPALAASHPALAAAAEVADVKNGNGLNIEALEWSGGRLLVGLRGPLLDGRAVLVTLANPDSLFGDDRIEAGLTTLDLDGDGMRSLAHAPALGGFLIISGPTARSDAAFRLWFWNGKTDGRARPVTVPGLSSLGHGEGLCQARIGGHTRIILVSDDGDRKTGRPARYLNLDPDCLVILETAAGRA